MALEGAAAGLGSTATSSLEVGSHRVTLPATAAAIRLPSPLNATAVIGWPANQRIHAISASHQASSSNFLCDEKQYT